MNFKQISRIRHVGVVVGLGQTRTNNYVNNLYPIFQTTMATSLFNRFSNHNRIPTRTLPTVTIKENDLVDSVTFEKVCEETLDSLTEYFEELVESSQHLSSADVAYSSGVLTVNFGSPFGTYVINRQSPNRQLWLSSPLSGPKRYDYLVEKKHWIYKHDGRSLHQLLQDEIPKIVKTKVDFSHCLHSRIG